jgi:polysaccharide biosynthesis protein PslH
VHGGLSKAEQADVQSFRCSPFDSAVAGDFPGRVVSGRDPHKMRVLMISYCLPYPPVTGGRLRIYNLLRRVASRHEISLAALLQSPEDAEGIPHLLQFCTRVETAMMDRRSRLAKASGMLRFALEGKPPQLRLLHSEELVEKIRQLFSQMTFDIVQIEAHMALYLAALPRTKPYKSLQMFQDVASQQLARISHIERRGDRKLRTWINAVTMGRWESRYAERFDRCITVSQLDQQLLIRANPRLQVDVIPNGVDTRKYRPLPVHPKEGSLSLLFVGSMGYAPCVDAVLYFYSEIFPLIRQMIPPVELRIVGADPPPEILKLTGPGVHVTGRVEDVVPYYQESTVCVVPLRAGGGTRLKILEAMALGRPVVSTSMGCEGLDVIDGEHLLIADNPERFAQQTVRLLRDCHLAEYIRANARKLVEARYDWDQIAERWIGIYEELAAGSNETNVVDQSAGPYRALRQRI